jgi:hypothetical protein
MAGESLSGHLTDYQRLLYEMPDKADVGVRLNRA